MLNLTTSTKIYVYTSVTDMRNYAVKVFMRSWGTPGVSRRWSRRVCSLHNWMPFLRRSKHCEELVRCLESSPS